MYVCVWGCVYMGVCVCVCTCRISDLTPSPLAVSWLDLNGSVHLQEREEKAHDILQTDKRERRKAYTNTHTHKHTQTHTHTTQNTHKHTHTHTQTHRDVFEWDTALHPSLCSLRPGNVERKTQNRRSWKENNRWSTAQGFLPC